MDSPAALEITRSLCAVFFHPLPLGVLVLDREGGVLYANPVVYTVLGMDEGTALPPVGEMFPEMASRRDEEQAREGFWRTTLVTPVQSRVPVTMVTYPLVLKSLGLEGYVMAFLDQVSSFQIQALFDEVHALSVVLHDERLTFEHLLDRLQSGIIWGNTEKLWYVNARARALLGDGRTAGEGIAGLFVDREKIMHYLKRRVSLSNLEMRLAFSSRSFVCLVNISYLPLRDEDGWLVEIVDIEEKKTIENSIMDIAQMVIQERNVLREAQRNLQRELQVAREIQFSLLPHQEFSSVAYLYQPMEELGGDFLDIFELDQDRLGIFMSDVCGHGIAASLLTVMVKQKLGEWQALAFSPHHLLTALNKELFHQFRGYFLTALYAVYDKREHLLTCANAGHPYPFLFSRGHFATLTTSRNQPIGVFAQTSYESSVVRLHPGERVLLYTDGLLETLNAQEESFEEKALPEVLEKYRDRSGYGFLQGILDELRQFHGGRDLDDDVALIVLDID